MPRNIVFDNRSKFLLLLFFYKWLKLVLHHKLCYAAQKKIYKKARNELSSLLRLKRIETLNATELIFNNFSKFLLLLFYKWLKPVLHHKFCSATQKKSIKKHATSWARCLDWKESRIFFVKKLESTIRLQPLFIIKTSYCVVW